MHKYTLWFIFLLLIPMLSACTTGEKDVENEQKISLTISAASSLNEVLTDLKKMYEEEQTNVEIVLNFGGSGGLHQQILQGAPVDLFFSASQEHFYTLLEKEKVDKDNWSNIVGNSLVLIQPVNTKVTVASFEDLKNEDINKIAIGTPESVPAGSYAKETLISLNLWDSIEKKTIPGKDVRQVLTYVETGNVDAGMVYKSDAMQSDKVKVIAEVDEDLHESILYPAGVINSSKNHEEAVQFYQFLSTDKAKQIFEKYGFLVLE